MRIGDVAKKTGLSIHALRYYERMGLIAPDLVSAPARGYREYDGEVLRVLHLIKSARNAGFSLAEISAGLKGSVAVPPAPDKLPMLEAKLTEIDEKIRDLNAVRGLIVSKIDRAKGPPSLLRVAGSGLE